jgi:DNA-binding response OmpR family regulator
MSDPAVVGKKVLIVEDEAPLRNALVDVFTLEGFTVLEANDGQQGLEIALREKPDMILLDIIMPIMDGMTMLRELRKDKAYGETASVIILTNLGMFNEEVSKGVNVVEPAFYLVKTNWAIEDVVKKVKTVLALAPRIT